MTPRIRRSPTASGARPAWRTAVLLLLAMAFMAAPTVLASPEPPELRGRDDFDFGRSLAENRYFEFARDTETPMRPTSPSWGRPGKRVISVHVSPPSVLLKSPLPGPPLDIWNSLR